MIDLESITRQALIYDATGVYRIDLAPVMYGLQVSTVHPGGCEDASLKFMQPFDGSLIIPSFIGFNFELQLWDEKGCYWIGRIEDFEYDIRGGSVEWSIVAKGYGVNLDDNLYGSQDVAGLITSTIVSNAITNLAPQIEATSVTATGVTLSAASPVNLKMMKASQVVNWAKRFGNSNDASQVWYVYPDNNATIRFTFGPRPTSADYEAHLSDFEQNRGGLSGKRLVNSVRLQYNAGASTVTADNLTLQGSAASGWNLKKVLTLFMNEVVASADAQQVADVALAYGSVARLAAKSLVLKPGAVVIDGNKQRASLNRVRAGFLLQLVDLYVSQSPLTNIGFINTTLITSTHWDEDAKQLTIIPESLDKYLDAILARSQIALDGRISL